MRAVIVALLCILMAGAARAQDAECYQACMDMAISCDDLPGTCAQSLGDTCKVANQAVVKFCGAQCSGRASGEDLDALQNDMLNLADKAESEKSCEGQEQQSADNASEPDAAQTAAPDADRMTDTGEMTPSDAAAYIVKVCSAMHPRQVDDPGFFVPRTFTVNNSEAHLTVCQPKWGHCVEYEMHNIDQVSEVEIGMDWWSNEIICGNRYNSCSFDASSTNGSPPGSPGFSCWAPLISDVEPSISRAISIIFPNATVRRHPENFHSGNAFASDWATYGYRQ